MQTNNLFLHVFGEKNLLDKIRPLFFNNHKVLLKNCESGIVIEGSGFIMPDVKVQVLKKIARIIDENIHRNTKDNSWLKTTLNHPVFKLQVVLRDRQISRPETLLSYALDLSHVANNVHLDWESKVNIPKLESKIGRMMKKIATNDLTHYVKDLLIEFQIVLSRHARAVECFPFLSITTPLTTRLNYLIDSDENKSSQYHLARTHLITMCEIFADETLSLNLCARELAEAYKENLPAIELKKSFIAEAKNLAESDEFYFYPLVSSSGREGLHSLSGYRYLLTGLKKTLNTKSTGFEKTFVCEVIAFSFLEETFGSSFRLFTENILRASTVLEDDSDRSKYIYKLVDEFPIKNVFKTMEK